MVNKSIFTETSFIQNTKFRMEQNTEDKRPRKKAKRGHAKIDDTNLDHPDATELEDDGVVMETVEEMVTEDIHRVTSEIEKEMKDQQDRYDNYVKQCQLESETEPMICDMCKCHMLIHQRLQNGLHFCRKATFLAIEKKHFTKTKSVNIPTLMTKTTTGAQVFRCPLCAEWHPITDACSLIDV